MPKTNEDLTVSTQDPASKNSVKSIFFSAMRILISFGALGIVIYMFRSKMGDVGHILATAKWHFFTMAFVLYTGAFVLITLRLKLITAVQKVIISVKNLLSIGLIGIFFNNILPSSIGGDAVKAYYAYRLTGKKMESFSAVFVDRILGLFTLITLALTALIFFRAELSNPKITEAVIALTLASLIILVFFGSRRIAGKLKIFSFLIPSKKLKEKIVNLYHSVYGYKKHPGIIISGLVLSFLSQTLFILTNFFMALSLNVDVPVWVFFILIPVIGAVSMAPSLNGLGVREGAYVYLFSHFCNPEKAFALSILNYSLLIAFSIAGGLIYLTRNHVLFKEVVKVDVIEELSHFDEVQRSETIEKEEMTK